MPLISILSLGSIVRKKSMFSDMIDDSDSVLKEPPVTTSAALAVARSGLLLHPSPHPFSYYLVFSLHPLYYHGTSFLHLHHKCNDRYFGRNIQFMRDLSNLAVDAFNGLRDAFDFYMYSVFTLFGQHYNTFFDSAHAAKVLASYPTLRQAVNA